MRIAAAIKEARESNPSKADKRRTETRQRKVRLARSILLMVGSRYQPESALFQDVMMALGCNLSEESLNQLKILMGASVADVLNDIGKGGC